MTDPSQQVLQAAAQGSWVAGMISFSLASEDINAASRPSANQADWDRSRAWDPASELVHCVPPGGDGVNEDAAEK